MGTESHGVLRDSRVAWKGSSAFHLRDVMIVGTTKRQKKRGGHASANQKGYEETSRLAQKEKNDAEKGIIHIERGVAVGLLAPVCSGRHGKHLPRFQQSQPLGANYSWNRPLGEREE
jgi:hypothetical protein